MLNFDQFIIKTNEVYEVLSKKYNRISNARLLIGVIGIIFFISSIMDKNILGFGFFLCCSVVFVGLIIYHEKLKEKKDYYEAKKTVLLSHMKRKNNGWSEFIDTGIDFLEEHDTIEKDLDIFGKNSLFQYLCVANTLEGRKYLSNFLTNCDFDAKTLYDRQRAVKEFFEKDELALELETLSKMVGMKNKKDSKVWYDSFLEYLNSKENILTPLIILCSILLPITTILLLVLSIKGMISIKIPCTIAVFQLIIAYYVSYTNASIISKVFRFCINIRGYYRIIKWIEQAEFSSDYLQNLQSKLSTKHEATKGIERLDYLNDAFSLQSNPYIHIFLQLFLMYDIHCIRALEKWKRDYANSMVELFKVVGEFEAILSLAMIGEDKEVSFPEITENSSIMFEAKDMLHPLIATKSVVSNSVQMDDGAVIITGSNMSGKTTFLRTIGLNMILAYAGAPVCAKRLTLSFMKLFTSMRVQDDVSRGVSSFYAEVLRMREMVEYSRKNQPMMVLIDEIFKGTNSADRIAGAKEIIKGLNKIHIIAAVSTHDFELCSLVEKKEIKGHNYHFEEYYEKDRICFDYKIRDGRCHTTNAKHILRMAGLIDNEKEDK